MFWHRPLVLCLLWPTDLLFFGVLPRCNYAARTVSDFFCWFERKKIVKQPKQNNKIKQKTQPNKTKTWECLQALRCWQRYYNWMAHFHIKTRPNGDAEGASLGVATPSWLWQDFVKPRGPESLSRPPSGDVRQHEASSCGHLARAFNTRAFHSCWLLTKQRCGIN